MKRLFAVLVCAAAIMAQIPGGTLRFCLKSEPRTFDPHLVAEEASEAIRYLTAGALVRLNRHTQKVEPALASSWKISEEGRKIVFQVRPGLKFSDGTPFGPADAAFSIRRLLDPKLHSATAEAFRSADGAAVVEVSKDAVTVRFPAPVAGLPGLFDQVAIMSSVSPLKEKAVLGPFQVKEYKAGQFVLLSRNPHYWKKDAAGRALPYLDFVRLDIQPNREIELLRFRRGEVHLINRVEPDLFDRLVSEHPEWVHDGGPSLESELMWFNQAPKSPVAAAKRGWFSEAGFRLAVSEAIRREDMCKVLYKGRAAPSPGPVSPSNRAWFNTSLKPFAHDPARAMKRLEKLGFRREGDRLLDRTGQPVEFSIVTNTSKTRERLAAMVRQDLARIGIKVNIVALDFPSLIERITRTFDYEVCMLVLTNVDIDPNGQMNVWLSSAATHQWNPSQPTPSTPWEAEIDRLMRAQAAAGDARKRKALFDQVQKIVAEQVPFVYLVNRHALSAALPGLKNVRVTPLHPHAFWNAEELYWAKPANEASGGGL